MRQGVMAVLQSKYSIQRGLYSRVCSLSPKGLPYIIDCCVHAEGAVLMPLLPGLHASTENDSSESLTGALQSLGLVAAAPAAAAAAAADIAGPQLL